MGLTEIVQERIRAKNVMFFVCRGKADGAAIVGGAGVEACGERERDGREMGGER